MLIADCLGFNYPNLPTVELKKWVMFLSFFCFMNYELLGDQIRVDVEASIGVNDFEVYLICSYY